MTRRLSALLLLGAATLMGCGGDPASVHVKGEVIHVKLDEYRITPQDVVIHAGRVHLDIENVGRLTHNLQIETFDPASGTEPHVYERTDTLQPGQSGHERVAVYLKPGKYRLTCTIANHDDLGQYGELRVLR